LWGLVTWQWAPAIYAGIFFELIWLDLFPAGTFIPPHGLLSVTSALTFLACMGSLDMRITTLCLLAAVPLAYLGSLLEARYRKRQNLSYNALLHWNRRSRKSFFTPQRLVLLAICEQFCMYLVLFAILVGGLLYVLKLIVPLLGAGPQLSWPFLWAVASLGAILSLRIRQAYAVGIAGLALGMLIGV